ncbi:MAG: PH domain-containing protein [Peptococcaceae bacterium]|nr:PH domain-containing protein [Peptococcaceae bacterium]
MAKPKLQKQEKVVPIWQDRKRTIFGLPWSFTKYTLTEEKFYQRTGFWNTDEDEVRLYRILDISLSRSFREKVFGLGSIKVNSADKSMGDFVIKRIKNPKKVRNLLSEVVESQRNSKGIIGREFLEGQIESGSID